MHAEQIGVQVHYVPLHEHPVFAEVRGADALAGTETVYAGLVSLPLHTTMTEADVASVIAAVERLERYYE
jgi:dTDP-4-amino-4,6-dideoxygalactose transaminase